LLRLLADTVELAAQFVRLLRTLAEPRVCLPCGHRLDPASTRPDRALGKDRERADLACRADVRAAAQLARPVAVDLDDAHDLAVLLAEEHRRAEPPRLLDRRLVDRHRHVREDLL